MRQFKVKAPIQLSHKRVAVFGAIVSEKQLHDNADELLRRGFIEVEAEKENTDETQKPQSAPKAPKAKKNPKTPKK